jgi:hypothetical protein
MNRSELKIELNDWQELGLQSLRAAEEFDAWDEASDEALINMERELANDA